MVDGRESDHRAEADQGGQGTAGMSRSHDVDVPVPVPSAGNRGLHAIDRVTARPVVAVLVVAGNVVRVVCALSWVSTALKMIFQTWWRR